jgi:CRISPR/Cas system-associated exonuclease Cas4 (RecB family)
MGYSKKQKLFADYLLNKIGITDLADIEIYLTHLEALYGRWESSNKPNAYGVYTRHYTVSACLELLMQEVDLKKKRYTIKYTEPKLSTSATDLASFDFCPVSYVISNSFLIENPSSKESTEIGKQFHEELLLAKTHWNEEDVQNYAFKDISFAIFRQSRLVFSGHQEENRVFTNGDWVGVPDYIFEDKAHNFFAVEEKFHRKAADPKKYSGSTEIDPVKTTYFFSNHIVQLASYIKNISEYPIVYGYLLYWYYDLHPEYGPYIHEVVAKKIILDQQTEELYNKAVNGIEKLRNNKILEFPIAKLNMRKCAGCVVNKYCGHKTKRFENLPFPYQYNFLNLYYADFPDELIKR